jgi:4-amino-4-deoxy-L-arabinose transferase-like glycosyltransferase
MSRLVRGREPDPAWVRPALLALLAGAGLLYLWGLGASGWANAFYSAAVQAASKSWKAFFFGSVDSSNFITVDKPPAALWVMGISARLFGVNARSILVPQALMGVAAVGLLYAAVRRRFSPAAGLLAGTVLALTPVAVLMFRFNNPDALLTLLLVGAAYAVSRAVERAGTRWLVLAGVLVGFAFLTKMLQALLVVPAFAFVYLLAAPTSWWRRIWQLLATGAAMVVSAGWWVAAVTLWPAVARPYIGGSQTNSVLELIFGYNGFGRLTGNETGSVGGGAAGTAGRWGPTGWLRMFNASYGGQISWLLPAALILMAALLWLWRREPRTDQRRAAVLLWGGWLLITGAVFSLAQGIIHEYYTVALAPAIGALVGIGVAILWADRDRAFARWTLAAVVAVTAVWSFVLLGRSPEWLPWLRPFVLIMGLGSAGLIAAASRLRGAMPAVAVAAAIAAGLAGTAAYSLSTAGTGHSGALPTAGPAVPSARTGPGSVAGPDGQQGPGGLPGGGFGGFPGGGTLPGAPPQGSQPPAGGPTGPGVGGGGLGGLLDASTPDAELVQLLQQDPSDYTWVAATVGANNAAGIQLAAGEPVMAIGGFNGSDPAPSLEEFQAMVTEGRIHYFVASGRGGGAGGGGGGSASGSEIASWVEQTFTPRTIGGMTVYDLTAAGT